jgi:ParB family chromosome partitioning protein
MTAHKRQSGLGRGLDALMGDAPAAREEARGGEDGRRRSLPIAFLRPNPEQPRRIFDPDAIEELAHSIRAKGMLQPILVRQTGPEAFEIVAGERRWRAAQKAQLHEAPVIIRELTDDEAAEIALVENVQRVDLAPLEEARAYQRLVEVHGRTAEEIARAIGKSRSHVANTLRLLALAKLPLEALERGEITAGHARALIGAPDQDLLLTIVRTKGLNVRDTEMLVRAAQDRAAGKPSPRPRAASAPGGSRTPSAPGKKDADTRALEADLSAALGLVVEIAHAPKGSGVLTISYRNLDQLDDVCRRLMGAGV